MNHEFMSKLRAGHEGCCPTCGRYAQVYFRRIHTSVALQLIQAYKLGGDTMYIHTSKLIAKGTSGVGDFSKAKYWKLIDEMPHTPAEKKSSGYWKLTDLGVEFVLHGLKIQKFAVVYDDKVIDMKGALLSIEDCLGDKFDYGELMGQAGGL